MVKLLMTFCSKMVHLLRVSDYLHILSDVRHHFYCSQAHTWRQIFLQYKDDRIVTRGLLSSGMWCCIFCKSLPTDEDGSRFLWKAGTYLPDCSVTSQKIVIFHMFLCQCKNVQIYLSSSKQEQ